MAGPTASAGEVAAKVAANAGLWIVLGRHVLQPEQPGPRPIGLEALFHRLAWAVSTAVVVGVGLALQRLGDLDVLPVALGVILGSLGLWVSLRLGDRARRRGHRLAAVLSPPGYTRADQAATEAAQSGLGGVVGLMEGGGAVLWLIVGIVYAGLAASTLLRR
jgi:hypothetical protein